jgi:NADPH:quinone reductase-like Zn-dependent oxidoreductase
MGSRSDVTRMLAMVAETGVTPVVDRVFPMEEAADALRYLASQERFGKVALSVS